jgi:hypothetical protein
MAIIESQTKCTLESNIWLNPCIIVGLFYDLSVTVKYDVAVDPPAVVCCSMSIPDHLTDGWWRQRGFNTAACLLGIAQ